MDTPLLQYTLSTKPEPLHIQKTGEPPASLAIVATNPGKTPIPIEKITLTIPTGSTAEALTPDPDNITPQVPSDGQWEHKKKTDPNDKTRYTITFSAATKTAKVSTEARFTLDNVDITGASGHCTLDITETSGGKDRKVSLYVQKFGSEFRINSFTVDKAVVKSGEKAKLSWDVVGATGYTVTWYGSDKTKPQSLELPSAKQFCETSELKSDTPVTLTAKAKSETGGYLAYSHSIIVMVDKGEVETGKLTVHGPVDIFRADPDVGENRKITLEQGTKRESCSFSSTTDGMLYIQPTSKEPKDSILPLKLRIPAMKEAKEGEAAKEDPFRSDLECEIPVGAPATIPLLAGRRLIANLEKDATKVTFAYYWFPLGSGNRLSRQDSKSPLDSKSKKSQKGKRK
ncbi:hypothetical protein ACIQU6_17305 [Streptomyces sp. NPDC090442]|uniref:hypothetical protein n=1 Tax=Streptomyces sp. NPDC090442 TaxID=3365962 RepID=UPI00381CBA4D